jgi:choline dehydrogenase-like flavoprotein
VVVVGSGPGGATVARELARKGRDVVIVERGKWHEWAIGRYASLFTITDMIRPKGGGLMARGITVGGSSVVYNGNAYDPPEWLATELDIDLSEETADTKAEIGIRPLPEYFSKDWSCTHRLVEAAGELDIALVPQQKFIDPEKCDPTCDDCMLGCRRGAKWTAREYVNEAFLNGAKVLSETMADSVIIENGESKGVRVKGPHPYKEIRADKVVISAGGIGTPIILLRSGIKDAGEGFFIDPMNVVHAIGKYPGPKNEMTFTFASEEFVEDEGYLVGTLGSLTMFSNQIERTVKSFGWALSKKNLSNVMGLFTKIGDSPGGRIHADGMIEKPYGPEDKERFRKGTEACKKILIKAGADPDTFTIMHNVGGHPGGTAAIGKVVDKSLHAYGAKNLYVCDASVFPRSPGRPPTLTIIALAKHLAKSI